MAKLADVEAVLVVEVRPLQQAPTIRMVTAPELREPAAPQLPEVERREDGVNAGLDKAVVVRRRAVVPAAVAEQFLLLRAKFLEARPLLLPARRLAALRSSLIDRLQRVRSVPSSVRVHIV